MTPDDHDAKLSAAVLGVLFLLAGVGGLIALVIQ